MQGFYFYYPNIFPIFMETVGFYERMVLYANKPMNKRAILYNIPNPT